VQPIPAIAITDIKQYTLESTAQNNFQNLKLALDQAGITRRWYASILKYSVDIKSC
jgi:hypothetical protein